jgi:predicted RNA-binding Zn-ribbon protein involved in translation (DUF1610 family)
MAIFACTSCGWVRRSPGPVAETSCPVCGQSTSCLTPSGRLEHGRARAAATTARALHDPAVAPMAGAGLDAARGSTLA